MKFVITKVDEYEFKTGITFENLKDFEMWMTGFCCAINVQTKKNLSV